jgi:hydroxyacylglutathione hydrolase
LASFRKYVIFSLFIAYPFKPSPSKKCAKLHLWFHFNLGCLAHASYCVYSPTSKAAFIVDPRRDVAPYLSFLEAHKLTLKAVLLTHVHADFVAGHLDLARLGGNVPVHVGASSGCKFDALSEAADGFTADLSDTVRIRAYSTPGHTLGCTTWSVEDKSGGDNYEKKCAFTGDTVFVGSVGRPDLVGMA